MRRMVPEGTTSIGKGHKMDTTIQWTQASGIYCPLLIREACHLLFPAVFPLFTIICKFTTKVLAAKTKNVGTPAKTQMTTTAEIKAWFRISFTMACSKISNVKK